MGLATGAAAVASSLLQSLLLLIYRGAHWLWGCYTCTWPSCMGGTGARVEGRQWHNMLSRRPVVWEEVAAASRSGCCQQQSMWTARVQLRHQVCRDYSMHMRVSQILCALARLVKHACMVHAVPVHGMQAVWRVCASMVNGMLQGLVIGCCSPWHTTCKHV